MKVEDVLRRAGKPLRIRDIYERLIGDGVTHPGGKKKLQAAIFSTLRTRKTIFNRLTHGLYEYREKSI